MNVMDPAGTALRTNAFWRRGRVQLLLDSAVIAAVVIGIAIIVKTAWPGFTYWGDNANSFFPLWHMLGTGLRNGEYLLFDHTGWGGANVVGEAAYGVFNPVTVANAVLISFFDNLARASFIVMAEFLALLAVGVYMLARVYGANRGPSMLAAVIVPFAGYTLFYEAGNWASGLMSITWVVHFWWAARAYSSGRTGPLPAVLFGGLAATVGNPYAVLGILVVLFGLAVELVLARDLRRLVGLVVAGACVGLIVLFVYLPLVNVMGQIDRPVSGFAENSNYLTPSLSDLFGMSSPGYLPRMRAWGSISDVVPSTYLSWIILPMLPWLRWGSLGPWKRRASLFISTVVFLLLTLGPDVLWLFRWPIRLVEYSYVGVAVVFALALSAGIAQTHLRRRMAATTLVVISIFFVSWASTPRLYGLHALLAALIGVLFIAAYFAYKRLGNRGLLAVVIAGTAVIAPIQAQQFGWSYQMIGNDVDQSVPTNLQTIRDASSNLDGTVLQVANIFDVAGDGSIYSGRLSFGNSLAAAGIESMNRYTGINFLEYSYALNMDYRGSIYNTLEWSAIFGSAHGALGAPLVDLMGVDTLVVSTARPDIDELDEWTDGWHVVEEDDVRVVLQRDEPIGSPVVTPSRGVEISDAGQSGNRAEFTYEAPSGGTVILDRLAWNGYSAKLGSETLKVTEDAGGLLAVELPPGAGTVVIDYEIPGMRLGLGLLAVGLGTAVVHAIIWRITWLRRRRSWLPEIVDDRVLPSHYSI